jgi:hypothetical protein
METTPPSRFAFKCRDRYKDGMDIDEFFALVWIPERHLRRKAVPLVLTFSFRERRPWPRWKEIYEVAPRRFTHHLELWSPADVDEEVRAWLTEAWERDAGEHPGQVLA